MTGGLMFTTKKELLSRIEVLEEELRKIGYRTKISKRDFKSMQDYRDNSVSVNTVVRLLLDHLGLDIEKKTSEEQINLIRVKGKK